MSVDVAHECAHRLASEALTAWNIRLLCFISNCTSLRSTLFLAPHTIQNTDSLNSTSLSGSASWKRSRFERRAERKADILGPICPGSRSCPTSPLIIWLRAAGLKACGEAVFNQSAQWKLLIVCWVSEQKTSPVLAAGPAWWPSR